jgi:hypothetical protein
MFLFLYKRLRPCELCPHPQIENPPGRRAAYDADLCGLFEFVLSEIRPRSEAAARHMAGAADGERPEPRSRPIRGGAVPCDTRNRRVSLRPVRRGRRTQKTRAGGRGQIGELLVCHGWKFR